VLLEKTGKLEDVLRKDFVNFKMWEKIDLYEREDGKRLGKTRNKVKDLNKMREIAFS
jgi:hypothetical protein